MGSLLSKLLRFIFVKTVPKFFLFFGLFYLVFEFTPVLISIVGGDALILRINGLFSSIPGEVAYFLSFFQIAYGAKVVISAYITRFIIRRIPLMGG